MSHFKEGDVVRLIGNYDLTDVSRGTHYTVEKNQWNELCFIDDAGDKRYVFLQSDEYMEVVPEENSSKTTNTTIKQKLAQIETLLAEIQVALG